MKYFCAKCQTKHSVEDIAADLWEICHEDVAISLNKQFNQWVGDAYDASGDSEKIAVINNALSRFVNTESESRLSFLFPGRDIKNHLQNTTPEETVLRGNFVLTLGWLIAVYKRNGNPRSQDYQKFIENEILIKDSWRTAVVFSREMCFSFTKVTSRNAAGKQDVQLVFAKVTDENNDPFTDENRQMRGFIRVCPHCGGRLSASVGRAEEIVIALAGAPRAGKTSCLVAVASALRSDRYARYGLSMEPLSNDRMWEQLRSEIDLYDKGYKVTKTPDNQTDVPSFSMLSKVGPRKVVLTFVDMPGEFWEGGAGLTPEFYTQYSGLYNNIDCVWFFISKLTVYQQSLEVDGTDTDKRKELVEATSEDSQIIKNAEPGRLGASLSALMEHLKAQNREMPPYAVIITKPEVYVDDQDRDIVERSGMFPRQEEVSSRNLRDIADIISVNQERRYFLKEQNYYNKSSRVRDFIMEKNPSLVRAVERSCSRKTYISMAAYGHPAAEPPQRGSQSAIGQGFRWRAVPPTPFHEMYPLIWSLSVLGKIQIEHGCKWRQRNFLGVVKKVEPVNRIVRYDTRRKAVSELEKLAYPDISSNLMLSPIRPGYSSTTYEDGGIE